MNNGILNDNKWNIDNYKKMNDDKDDKFGYSPLRGIQEKSQLSQTYFSKENLNLLQRIIIQSVYDISKGKYKIGKQSEQELLIIMRNNYLKYSKNLDYNIKEQIQVLNDKVIKYCVEIILTNIKQQQEYIKEIDRPLNIFNRGVSTSIKGDKTTEVTKFI